MSRASRSVTPRSGIAVFGEIFCGARSQRTMFSGLFGMTPARYWRVRHAVERRTHRTVLAHDAGNAVARRARVLLERDLAALRVSGGREALRRPARALCRRAC